MRLIHLAPWFLISLGLHLPNCIAIQSDSDGDGLDDVDEALWLCDSSNADSDGDTVPDGDEVEQLLRGASTGFPFAIGKLTIENDRDRDGVPDTIERIIDTNPEDPDTDGDRYSDGLEFFGADTNGNRMPLDVLFPGNSPVVAAFPDIAVSIAPSDIQVELVAVIIDSTNYLKGVTIGYSATQTTGQSMSVGNTSSHITSGWQEVGNREADSESRKSYQEDLVRSSSVSSRAYREGASTSVETGQKVVVEAGVEATTGFVGVAPYGKAKASIKATAELYGVQKTALETESLIQQRDSIDVQKLGGTSYEVQRVREISTTRGVGHETGFSATTTHTSYQETSVTHSQGVITSTELQRAIEVATTHAGELKFILRVQNRGTVLAEGIRNLRFNIQIGDPARLITYPTLDAPGIEIASLSPGETKTYNVGPIKLSLAELRSLHEGKPLRAWLEDYDYTNAAIRTAVERKTVLVEIDDGIDADNTNEIERFMIATWGGDTYQRVLSRFFPATLAANQNLASLTIPELDPYTPPIRWTMRPVSTNAWWDIFLCKVDASVLSSASEPFRVHRGDTLTLAINGVTNTVTFSNVTDGAATARQIVNALLNPAFGLRVGAMSMTVSSGNQVLVWSPVTSSEGSPTIQFIGGSALSALGFSTSQRTVNTPGRFIEERSQPGTRIILKYVRDSDLDGYSDRQEFLQNTNWWKLAASHPDPNIELAFLFEHSSPSEFVKEVKLIPVLRNTGDFRASGVRLVLFKRGKEDISLLARYCGGTGALEAGAELSLSQNSFRISGTPSGIENSKFWVLLSYYSPSGPKQFVYSLDSLKEQEPVGSYSLAPTGTWREAQQWAIDHGRRLVVITNSTVNAVVYNWLKDNGVANRAWIGATDLANEGAWAFVDGRLLKEAILEEWSAWFKGGGPVSEEPDDFAPLDEDYAAIDLENGAHWVDLTGEEKLVGITERITPTANPMTARVAVPELLSLKAPSSLVLSESNRFITTVSFGHGQESSAGRLIMDVFDEESRVVHSLTNDLDFTHSPVEVSTSLAPAKFIDASAAGSRLDVLFSLVDGDGYVLETKAANLPLLIASEVKLQISRVPERIKIRVESETGGLFVLEWNSNLKSQDWAEVRRDLSASGSFDISVSVDANSKFFRVRKSEL